MHLLHPLYLWWLPALALLGAYLIGDDFRRQKDLCAFVGPTMLPRLADYSPTRAAFKSLLVVAALSCLVIGLAEPQWGSRLVTVEREGIDVVLAVDCSTSMNAQDVNPSRMAVAQREMGELLRQLEGNRLGLVGFAGSAFSLCPLTLDVSATQLFLEQLDTNQMPIQGTSLGDAIHASLDSFPPDDPNKKVVVLLTDGEDHHSNPLEAAREAAKAGVTIYTVGIGNPTGEPIPETEGGQDHQYLRDSTGNVVMSRLDEETLRQISQRTGGLYLHVDGTQPHELAPILLSIAGTEKHKLRETTQRLSVERFQILLLAALALLGVENWLTNRRTGAQRPRSQGSQEQSNQAAGRMTP